MKRICCLLLCTCLLFLLSGCNSDLKAELQTVIDVQIESEEIYTPISYENYLTALSEAKRIKEKYIVSVGELEEAKATLNAAIDSLCIKPDKSPLEKLLNEAAKFDLNKYTTASCFELDKRVSYAATIVANENATQSDVDGACDDLEKAIGNMTIATKGVYIINCKLTCLATNHVGNDWQSYITYNGNTLRNGDKINAPLKGSVTIVGTAIENDNVPDYGSGTIQLPLEGGEKSTRFYVRENRGRYAGNTAIWELTGSATLVERK